MNKTEAAKIYCEIAIELETAKEQLKAYKDNVIQICERLEKLREIMGEGLTSGEGIVITLPDNVAVVVNHNSSYIEADISRFV